MVVTDVGLSGTALAIGSFSPNRPQWMILGSGSGTALPSVTGLYAQIGSPEQFDNIDNSSVKQVTWQTEWTAPAMSGLNLREFVLTTGSTDAETWNYENLGDEIEFNGQNELRLELKFEFF